MLVTKVCLMLLTKLISDGSCAEMQCLVLSVVRVACSVPLQSSLTAVQLHHRSATSICQPLFATDHAARAQQLLQLRWRALEAATMQQLGCSLLLVLLLGYVHTSHANTKTSKPTKTEHKPGSVVELSEEGFHQIEHGIWLVDVYATWCSHCRQLEPIWREVARKVKDQPDIHVSKVDGPKNRLWLYILRVDAFPSIFLLRDNRMWAYSGAREVDAIIEFATKGYKTAEPLPVYRCPNHVVGRALSRVYALPVQLRAAYSHLREDRGWSDLTILLAALAVPLVTGVATLCFMDALYVRKARYLDDDEHEAAADQPPPVAAPAEAAR